MDNATEVEIRQKNKVITKFKIVSAYGTLSLGEIMLEAITDAKNDGSNILSQTREGGIIFASPEELRELRNEVKNMMYFPDDDENFSFGRSRNSRKQEFIESFMPLYRCLSERIKMQSAPIFDSYRNRDYYQFILDLLEIPIDFICIDDMELYLKSPQKIDAKKVDLDLPF